MRRVFLLGVILILIATVGTFGQNRGQKRKSQFRPEVGDEVLVSIRHRSTKGKTSKKSLTTRKKGFFDEADALWGRRRKPGSGKYANQEISYRTKSKRKKSQRSNP